MRRVTLMVLAMLSLTACDPAVNPVMALGQNVNSGTVPLQEYKVYFKEPVSEVYKATLVAGNRNELNVIDDGGGNFVVIVHYDFSMVKNVWGGQFRVGLDSIGGKTRLTASFYEKSKYVTNSVLNPFVEDINFILSSSGVVGDRKSGAR
ncbi:hypothetical protein [Paramagnetospirillum magnetotacticum]|uniref:hypothetical protein n=1 Tax=Paramagnetospirillum magnetotacticum TaxID=188 RepID=UPI0012699326|nr:hypothetical protein [Paramagnetospirillum magnetotacticum]